MYRDYGPKKVKFFFVYKALAHPERNDILQPITLDERLVHAREGTKRLGNTIPWLVDAIDNRLKHALGDRNNSEFIVDPEGKIVRKRTWSNPDLVRKDLEELVGKVEKITKVEDIVLKTEPIPKPAFAKGVVERIGRPNMTAVLMVPQADKSLYYAKLRPEAEATVFDEGKGKLYLGFHLDPFIGAHWNNLKKPLRFEIDAPGVKLSTIKAEAVRPKVDADLDPREFLLDVVDWPADKPIRLTVSYAACTDDVCHEVTQVYVLSREKNRDGGRATTGGLRARSPEEMVKLLLDGDKNKDGKLTAEELHYSLRSRFAEFDLNKDGVLDKDELEKMSARLTERKRP